jgi:hypothetical protein
MGLIRIQTVQAHPIPRVVGGGSPPWDPAVIQNRPEKLQWTEQEFPRGATVLNGFTGVPLFSCDLCGTVVAESEMDFHDCGLVETDEED